MPKTANELTTYLRELPAGSRTPAQEVAIRQGWSLMAGTTAELKAALAATPLLLEQVPTVEALAAQNPHAPADEIKKEHARLVRNAKTNEWRVRTRLQATIDTRQQMFAKRFAKKEADVTAAATSAKATAAATKASA